MIRGPGVPAGVTVDDLSINADLAPTIVDAAGRDRRACPRTARSLLPFAAHPDRCHGRELLIEKGDVVDDDDDGVPQSGTFAAMHTNRYIYVENVTGEIELYDLDADPYELQNQVGKPRLRRRRGGARRAAGDPAQLRGRELPVEAGAEAEAAATHPPIENGHSCRDPRKVVIKLQGAAQAERGASREFASARSPAGTTTPCRSRSGSGRGSCGTSARPTDPRDSPSSSTAASLTFQKRVRICR